MTVRVNKRLIRELRIRHSYSQERLAEIVGVNLRTIQRIETNGVASLATRGALARAFGLRPEDLDARDEDSFATRASVPHRRSPGWLILLSAVALVAVGWIVLAVSITRSIPTGRLTPEAVVGILIAGAGFLLLTRLTPFGRSRVYAVLSMVAVALLASPPAWTIQAFVTISLWAAFELGIVLTGRRLRARLS